MPVMNMFPGGSTLQIPLDAPTSLAATAGNAQVELTWTDPKDKYATPEGEVSETGDQLVSEWSHTVLVRKTGSQPAGPDDGTVVVSSSVRNQYQTTPYTDTGLTNDTLYYYGVFAYNKDGVASPGAFVSATPKAGTPLSELTEGTIIKINENGSPVEFYLAKHNYEPTLNGEGRELLVRKDCYAEIPWDDATSGGINNSYEISSSFSWGNTSYKSLFSPAVQALMGITKFTYSPGYPSTSTATLEGTVFSLSVTEIGSSYAGGGYNSLGSRLPIYAILKVAYFNGVPDRQQTRTTMRNERQQYLVVMDNGGATPSSVANSDPIRPCFTLPSTSLIDLDLNLVEPT